MKTMRSHHGGESSETGILDFSVNLNPLGMPACAVRALREDRTSFELYPDTECRQLRRALSLKWDWPERQIVCGGGAADLIYRIPAALKLKKVLLAVPSFTEYERALRVNGTEIRYLETSPEENFVLTQEYRDAGGDYDALVISNPGNPSGCLLSPENYRNLLKWCAETKTVLISDECFIDFADPEKRQTLEAARREVPEAEMIILRSFTKIYAMAGLRIGCALFDDPEKAEAVALTGPPWSVPGPAQQAAIAALSDDTGFVQRTRRLIRQERQRIGEALRQSGVKVYKSDVNFLLFEASSELGEWLKAKGIFLRDCSDYPGIPVRADSCFYRAAVRSESENEQLIHGIQAFYEREHFSFPSADAEAASEGRAADSNRTSEHSQKKHAASLMIQGTMSNAGKSLIAAGLCRIFLQDGFHPAPFKSQNMALNSHITTDGKEIGRAQAVQAEAAGIEPTSDMNPILLKPTTEKGSQVIVNGEVRCRMDASDYFEYRRSLKKDVMAAYHRLEEQHDIIIIEGAGSPVEINLTRNGDDFVNMGLAESIGAPVVLVGDIDRGGVFAQLGGTMMLLDGAARDRVKGVIVNKFRGDLSLFEDGKAMLSEVCGVPVLGVVPYTEVDIDDEDSLSSRLSVSAAETDLSENLKIGVIRLPHISNFSDLTALDAVEGVQVYYAERPEHLEQADAVIIPGTKNTMGDLQWLRKTGLAEAVIRAAEKGIPVTGICGGYQMLGETILDREAVESGITEMKGLGLLPVDTEYEPSKVTRRMTGKTAEHDSLPEELRNIAVSGYEIHMGRSTIRSAEENETRKADTKPEKKASLFSMLDSGEADGCAAGTVFGTYLHGLFDSGEFTLAYCRWAARCCHREIDLTIENYREYREKQYDKLADALRQSLDLEEIYRIMGVNKE